MTLSQEQEYAQLYQRREELQQAIAARLRDGVQSASLSSGGASQSYTALDVGQLRAELRAVTQRMHQLLDGRTAPFAGCRTSVPDFTR